MEHALETGLLLGAARQAANKTGDLIREKWSQPRQIKNKGFRDLVTDTDVAAQKLITDLIRAQFPDHGFLTEEDDSDLPTGGPVIWVIDPVDGTTNFSRSVPTFCVSVAAVSDTGEQLAGVVYDPMRDEMFGAARAQGAWLQQGTGEQRPLSVSQVDTLDDALFALDWSRKPDLRRIALEILVQIAPQVHDVRALGAAALALCWLAAGRVDGYVNMQLSPWDLAAACLIIREAGGQISRPDGQPWHYSTQSGGVIASNGRLHQAILGHVSPITRSHF
jgi:myo-inositol-1(or 4)-monophosphatase